MAGMKVNVNMDKAKWDSLSPREKRKILDAEAATLGIPDSIPKYYLDCKLYQRSADLFLDTPYNIASYALLTYILADMLNFLPGIYTHTFGDVHIYDNHIEPLLTQIARKPKTLPHLRMNIPWDEIGRDASGLTKLKHEWFTLEGYDPHPFIKGELSTGMVKPSKEETKA